MWQPLHKQISFLDARKKVYRTTLLGEKNFPSKAFNEFIIISRLKGMKTISCRYLRVNWWVGFLKDASFLPTKARPSLKLFWAQMKKSNFEVPPTRGLLIPHIDQCKDLNTKYVRHKIRSATSFFVTAPLTDRWRLSRSVTGYDSIKCALTDIT